MKKILSMVLVVTALTFFAKDSSAASSDLWCVGSTTKGECINSAGSIIPAADGTHNLGSAAKSFGSAWMDGTLTVNNLIVTGTLSPYSTGTFTGESISLTYGLEAATATFTGAISAASYGAVSGTTGAFSSTLAADGNVTLGAANYKSTMTASNGNWAITGDVVSAGAVQGATVTGTTSVTSPLFISTGANRLYSRTKAQILALTPAAAGEAYYCSDCTAVAVCISTGTGTGAYTKITDKAAACD